MSGIVKVLLGLVLGLPVGAYAVGSLVATSAEPPSERAPIILQDPPAPTQDSQPGATIGPEEPDDDGEDDDRDDDGSDDGRRDRPEVVVPSYVDRDDDDDRDDDGGGGDDTETNTRDETDGDDD